MTTYYPAPYGNYNEIQLAPHVTTTACDATSEGTVYYDSVAGEKTLKVCRNTSGSTYSWEPFVSSVWTTSGNNVYTLGRVGIGASDTSNAQLHVASTSGATTLRLEQSSKDYYNGILLYGPDKPGLVDPYISMAVVESSNVPSRTVGIIAGGHSITWMPLIVAYGAVNNNQGVAIGGTLAPNNMLDVKGNINFTGILKKNNLPLGTSDIRLKKDVAPLTGSLAMVERLQGVSFEWRTEDFPERGFEKGKQFGLIAQDVEKVAPELVSTDTGSEGYKSVEYGKAVPILIEAIKEQQIQIDELNKIVQSQQKKLDAIEIV